MSIGSVAGRRSEESKELIGGFAVMELRGMDEAIEISRAYAKLLGGTLEADLRVVEVEEEK